MKEELYNYLLRLGDNSLIMGQRLGEWCGHGPVLEEDIALTNIALDFIGQATQLLEYAGVVGGEGKSADDIAFLRDVYDFNNILLVEQPNGDFGVTIARQFFLSAYQDLLYRELMNSKDERLAAIAAKSSKELGYHYKHSREWILRLGDGTEESHNRV
jgi:ring-1,2-phenylacetyl-CoA epoxidase subunit PaaC